MLIYTITLSIAYIIIGLAFVAIHNKIIFTSTTYKYARIQNCFGILAMILFWWFYLIILMAAFTTLVFDEISKLLSFKKMMPFLFNEEDL